MVSYLHVVGYLAQVVYLDAVAYYGGFHRGAVYGGAGAYLHVVAYYDVAQVLYLLPGAVRLRHVAESVGAYDAVGVEDDPVSYLHPRVNADAGVYDAVAAYLGAVAYVDVAHYTGAVAYGHVLAYVAVRAYGNLLAHLGAEGDGGGEAAAAPVRLLAVGYVFEEVRQGGVGVLYAHHCGGDWRRWLEVLVHQQDAGFTGVDVMLVFGIGKETQVSALAVLYLGEAADCCVRVSVDGSLEDLCQFFCCKFHRKVFCICKFSKLYVFLHPVKEIGAARFLFFNGHYGKIRTYESVGAGRRAAWLRGG